MPSLAQLQRLAAAKIGIPPWIGMNLVNPAMFGATPAFANAGGGLVAAQYRTWELINEVEVIGTISLPGVSAANNNNAFILPYRLPAPLKVQQIPMVAEGQSAALVTTPYLQIDQFGTPIFANLAATSTRVSFHGWYSLDA